MMLFMVAAGGESLAALWEEDHGRWCAEVLGCRGGMGQDPILGAILAQCGRAKRAQGIVGDPSPDEGKGEAPPGATEASWEGKALCLMPSQPLPLKPLGEWNENNALWERRQSMLGGGASKPYLPSATPRRPPQCIMGRGRTGLEARTPGFPGVGGPGHLSPITTSRGRLLLALGQGQLGQTGASIALGGAG